MNPDTALAEALATALKAAPAVTALVAARAYAVAPRSPTYPCVAVSRIESRPVGGVDGEGLEHLVTLTAVSKFGGPEEARAVVAAVRAVLHDARPAVTGRRLVNLRVAYADVFRAADRELSLGVLRVRAVTEPL
jgi:hypothetical protein